MSAKKKSSPKHVATSPARQDPADRIEVFFTRRFYPMAFGVLAIALLLRIGMLIGFSDYPYNATEKGAELDMQFFNIWADRVADGDILTDTILHPYHVWHDAVARASGAGDEAAGRQLWSRWYGGKTYHQEPLYALFAGAVKRIFGKGLIPVYVIQSLISLLGIWLIMLLGRHYAGAIAGIAGGLLFALYNPGIIFDFTLLRTSLQTTTMLGMVWIAERVIAGKAKAWGLGLIGGIGYLLASTFLLLWGMLLARWLYVRRQDLRLAWQPIAVFGFFIGLLWLRNACVGAPLTSISSVGPVTYALANYPGYDNFVGFNSYPEVGALLEESKGSLASAVRLSIDRFDSPLQWVVLQFHKLLAVFHPYEIPNNINTYLAAAFSPVLRGAFVPYALIAGLGLWGWILSLFHKRAWSLSLALLTQIAILVGFYVLCRFRLPFTAGLAVFAGVAVQWAVTMPGRPGYRKIVYSVAPVLMTLAVVNLPPRINAPFMQVDYGQLGECYFNRRINERYAAGDYAGCIALYERILSTMPAHMRDIRTETRYETANEKGIAWYYGQVYNMLSTLYTQAGNPAKAADCAQRGQRYTQAAS